MFLAMLKNNHALQAVVIPAALGAFCWLVNAAGKRVAVDYILSHMYSSISISNSDTGCYNAVLDYIRTMDQVKNRQLMAYESSVRMNLGEQVKWLRACRSGDDLDGLMYMPADNNTLFLVKFKGRLIFAFNEKIQDPKTVRKKLCMYVLGNDTSVLKSLISDAVERVAQDAIGVVRIYQISDEWPHYWICVHCKRPRSINSVVLDSSIPSSIVQDARDFLSSKRWYDDMGIPYRRGYLLHGPPGCGKTSFCQALAGVLGLDIVLFSLTSTNLDDSNLATHIRSAPKQSIILLEDVDAVFSHKDDGTRRMVVKSRVTFSALLNAIDGIAAQEGRLMIMTTNHIDRLDPALKRPGRCDLRIMFEKASHAQIMDMFLRMFPGRDEDARRFADSLPERSLSLAQVQEHLVHNRQSVERVLETSTLLLQLNEEEMSLEMTTLSSETAASNSSTSS